MKVYNQDKTQILTDYDLDLGYLKQDTLVVHHDAIEPIKEQGHYITLAEYPNGGKDVEWVVDVKGVEGREAYDEVEDIYIYVLYSKEELQIKSLKEERVNLEDWLKAHDYIGIKIATGRATIEEYSDVIREMKVKAQRINEIDEKIKSYLDAPFVDVFEE